MIQELDAEITRLRALVEKMEPPFEVKELINMVLVLQWPYTQEKINEVQSAAEGAVRYYEQAKGGRG